MDAPDDVLAAVESGLVNGSLGCGACDSTDVNGLISVVTFPFKDGTAWCVLCEPCTLRAMEDQTVIEETVRGAVIRMTAPFN